jgi:GMP synthase-like glutamine amidotransferase
VGERAYGLQFHVEVDRQLAASLAPHLPSDVALPELARAAVETSGRGMLQRFFAATA